MEVGVGYPNHVEDETGSKGLVRLTGVVAFRSVISQLRQRRTPGSFAPQVD